jgi:predicted dehydrogenase/threonine dehydrogenase-like Zn-dependent dehydrogenase
MRQVIQSLNNGTVEAVDAPAPSVRAGALLIETQTTLVSAGTERMLVEFGRANLLQKARSQPGRVRDVLHKARTDGISATWEAVRAKLDQPIPLGYCNAGKVVAVGAGVTGFEVGDRVICNGAHAEIVAVPPLLCATIPDAVSAESAAFVPLAAIGLQGVRLAAPSLGERVAVFGLGLIGLLTVQILRANGCTVLGIDTEPARLALARQFGAIGVDLSKGEDPIAAADLFTGGLGVDAVLVTASTESHDLIRQAARMSRKRGRIVLVGITGLHLDRADFYEKELSFQVSCSYGPGRYDSQYEERGHDYPIGFVRWTEQRNFEAVLELMRRGALDVRPLITHRFSVEDAAAAYEALVQQPGALAILLNYPEDVERDRLAQTIVLPPGKIARRTTVRSRIAVLGAGNYASRMLVPALRAAGADCATIISRNGLSALLVGRRDGFDAASTDTARALADPSIGAVIIATRHDSHAELAIRALDAGKSVFVEKPLALDEAEIDAIVAARARAFARGESPVLMVGFNRRFAPLVVSMQERLKTVSEPKAFIYTINAGSIPSSHWTQDRDVGGGRIVGEVCHFIDLLRFLAGAPISRLRASRIGRPTGDGVRDDKAMFTLEFEDGSIGTIHYLANGASAFPKERLEVFVAGRVLQLDNFRRLRGWGWRGVSGPWGRQDKGQKGAATAFMAALHDGGGEPIPFDELVEISRWAVRAARFDELDA